MSDKGKPTHARKTRTEGRPGPREIPGDVLPARSTTVHTPVKRISSHSRRPVSTVSVSALFL